MTQEKKEKLTTKIVVAIVTTYVVFAMVSCSPKYGCKGVTGVGYGAIYHSKR